MWATSECNANCPALAAITTSNAGPRLYISGLVFPNRSKSRQCAASQTRTHRLPRLCGVPTALPQNGSRATREDYMPSRGSCVPLPRRCILPSAAAYAESAVHASPRRVGLGCPSGRCSTVPVAAGPRHRSCPGRITHRPRIANQRYRYVLLIDPAVAIAGLKKGDVDREWLDTYDMRRLGHQGADREAETIEGRRYAWCDQVQIAMDFTELQSRRAGARGVSRAEEPRACRTVPRLSRSTTAAAE